MPGKQQAIFSGRDTEDNVAQIAYSLGLDIYRQVKVGRRVWGAERRIDIVLRHPETRQVLGVECKFQGGSGSTEEKIPATVKDIEAWPMPGIVVIAGEGFSDNMRSYLYSTGKAVDIEDLEMWLRLFYGLDF
jgi:hypothetical protein